MRTIIFTPTARREIIEARDWYEDKSAGLGRSFITAIDAVIERISANPEQFPVMYKNVRRALFRRFPYSLMFVVELDESVTVLACFHASRDPARWQRRM